MLNLFKESIQKFFTDDLGLKVSDCKYFPKHTAYCTDIEFSFHNKSYSAMLWIQRPVLKQAAQILLFEENPDEATIEDLTNEIANFIVGYAKMRASNKNIACKIKTPSFLGQKRLKKDIPTILYKIENRCIALQAKELYA